MNANHDSAAANSHSGGLMANFHGASSIGYSHFSGKQTLFPPPKNPLTMPSASLDYKLTHAIECIEKEGVRPHQRTTSEIFLLEEQPSWLDDLLNESVAPLKKGAHRRSSSDSFAYFGKADNLSQEGYAPRAMTPLPSLGPEKFGAVTQLPSWGSEEFGFLHGIRHSSYMEANSYRGPQSKGREPAVSRVPSQSGNVQLAKDKTLRASSSSAITEHDASSSNATQKQSPDESGQDHESPPECKESVQPKNTNSDMEKRAKQQFAQRSRVRKLQYIAELERNVQALQAEGIEFSAQLVFLDQQNLILDMENKALKQRLDSLAQEHLVKCLQQEMLEKEISRLRGMYYHHQQQQQHQQHQQQPLAMHRRNRSRDLDSHFSNLSMRQTESSSGTDNASRGQLHI